MDLLKPLPRELVFERFFVKCGQINEKVLYLCIQIEE